MKVFGYVEEVLLMFKELLCNLSILGVVLHTHILYMVCTSIMLW